jgi:uncharacterized protein with PIN domain
MCSVQAPETRKVIFRFYGDLKRFLSADRQARSFAYYVKGRPIIKDTIEALGVPHTEVDAIVVDGQSVNFRYQLKHKASIYVYPDVLKVRRRNIKKLKPKVPVNPRFVLDVHLGKLCRYLRLLGFDALYDARYTDPQLVRIGVIEKRMILTRDIGLLKNKQVRYGYFIRQTDPHKQMHEVIAQFQLKNRISPFKMCLKCNGRLRKVAKKTVISQLPQQVKEYFDEFCRCPSCGKIYWKGSHYDRLEEMISQVLK